MIKRFLSCIYLNFIKMRIGFPTLIQDNVLWQELFRYTKDFLQKRFQIGDKLWILRKASVANTMFLDQTDQDLGKVNIDSDRIHLLAINLQLKNSSFFRFARLYGDGIDVNLRFGWPRDKSPSQSVQIKSG